MKLTKHFYTVIIAFSVLSACNQNENRLPVNGESESEIETKEVVKKHESVNLPVNVFVNKNHYIGGEKVTYSRSITDVTIQSFDEATEIEYLDRLGSAVRSQGFDLRNDYKLLVIIMKQEVQEKVQNSLYDKIMLNEGSGLVIGDIELANQNEFIMYQQEFWTTDYKVGSTFDKTGKILMAIPNDYANDPNLQLKIIQDLDGEKKYIYVDMK